MANDIRVLWSQLIAFSIIVLTAISCLIFAPKNAFSDHLPYTIASSLASLDSDNLLLYDYKVYSNENRFNDGLIYDVAKKLADFKQRSEILAVKVPGDYSVEYKTDYYLIHDSTVPELNIEYYLVKNITFSDTSLPARTVILLLNEVFSIVDLIYLGLLIILTLSFTLPFSIKIVRVAIKISSFKKSRLL